MANVVARYYVIATGKKTGQEKSDLCGETLASKEIEEGLAG